MSVSSNSKTLTQISTRSSTAACESTYPVTGPRVLCPFG
jgi:hypothetical protein